MAGEEHGSAPERPALRFTVLGPLGAEADGRPLPLGPLKQRLVLALLLCHANTPVPVDLLTDAVWNDEPPRTARKNLQVYASALRRLLGGEQDPGRLVHQPGGYLLRMAPEELDLLRFRELARSGRAAAVAGERDRAAGLLGRALDLWHGAPLADLHGSPQLRAEAERLESRCVAVHEDWAETELALGRAPVVADRLREVAERHPLRERLQAVRMTALHRSGRRTEALAAYEELRQLLARELGLTPSPQLTALYRSVLEEGPAAPAGSSGSGGRLGSLLPPDTADFTGRTEQLDRLTAVLRRGGGRAVVLTGPAGVGKTSLAVQTAYRLREEFPDGRLMVALRAEDGTPRRWSEVVDELVVTCGLAGRVPNDPRQAAAALRALLAERRLLLVLDDAADETVVRALLPGTGRSAAVVTSRTALAGLDPVLRMEVPPFTEEEALDLLGRTVGAARVVADPAAAQRIVEAVGMLPLAVRVSGMRLAVLRHLPLAEYADRLAEPGMLLDELAVGDVAVRPRLASCWHDLAEPRRAVLLRLGRRLPLAEPFSLDEAAAALGCDRGPALRELERLIESGAVSSPEQEVTAHAVRYSMPRLVQLYARERAAEAAA
ncbi:BTAD domain-containing putative transcriptional regulator [Kitasatospora camelliae]|uniref:BTAD domain-containing putative transcriptional regulator n=1 Tax=Kitasatospora camelliae TaxID=3156397 RepID=A0AAU8K491_9ACTN